MAPAAPQEHEISWQDIREAVAKAAELRALHAALLQSGSVGGPSTLRQPVESSLSLTKPSHRLSSEEYPVFTPSYEEEPLPAYHYFHSKTQALLETSSTIGLEREGEDGKRDFLDDKKGADFSSTSREDQMFSTADSQKSFPSSCANCAALQQTSPETHAIVSTGRSGSEHTVVTTCNKCKPATIRRVTDLSRKSYRNNTTAVHYASDTQKPSLKLHQSNRGAVLLSWLFPFKRKHKSDIFPKTLKPEVMPRSVKEWGICSLETLKKELIDAYADRDAAMAEVGEMRSSLKELEEKLMHLEAYCKRLKKALKQAMQGKDGQFVEQRHLRKRTKSLGSSVASSMPVSDEVMWEGFLQMVSESRVSVKELCKILVSQNEGFDIELVEKLNVLALPNNMTLNNGSRCPRELQYHLEAIINQTLYQDFENCVFQTNGAQKILDPQHDCLENFSAFVTLRSLSWKEALSKGSRYYSEVLSKFCDQKMGFLVSALVLSRPWPEQVCQSFFVAAKCIWLLHLLAFSFTPPLAILRVEANRKFDPLYMEDILSDGQRAQAPAAVKIMVMPGFYAQERIVRCGVLCSYRSVV